MPGQDYTLDLYNRVSSAKDVAALNALEASRSRRHVFMFKPRFAPLVEAGTKPTTIRPPRKREVRVGDVLDLRTWTGAPYRSKQRKLREEVCVEAVGIALGAAPGLARIAGGAWPCMEWADVVALARGEGFPSVSEMWEWFEAEHGLPFTGTLYRWRPTP